MQYSFIVPAVVSAFLAAPAFAKPVVLDCSISSGADRAGLSSSYFIVLDEISEMVTISTTPGKAPVAGHVTRTTANGAVVEWPSFDPSAKRYTARVDLSEMTVAVSQKGGLRKARGHCDAI